VVSHFPQQGLGQFLAEQFDLASIRSSLGPRRTPSQRSFAHFQLKPSRATDTLVEFTRPNWFYQMVVTERRDINGDGIEDLAVCFTDKAIGQGNYDAQHSLLVTRYSANGYALALEYGVDACASVRADAVRSSAAAVGRQIPEAPYYEVLGRFIYGYHREGVSLEQMNDPELARRGPPELATRARNMARQFDWILHGEIKPPEAELNDILREAVAISAAIREWRQGAPR
jgi:hypothetical protein